ncbi:ABC transporter substrate-binding protein [Labrenzia sp. VG12]|uniref:substrate-binding periplasmic protein n=1 Tax=Labrenzia sp. VG12 TaxID=2021862 RepID=UPI000B8BEDE7|nr:transporter substrate-binding domain-containing protein [Labrenzia sp. VG12]ASP34890.1 amino acid ABC transporter substrate-binding protein [Labrenzia sp. VG12]
MSFPVFLSALLALLLTPISASGETWLASSETDFPPYNFPAGGKHVGIDTEIVQRVIDGMGEQVLFVQLPWKRVVQSVEQNEVDLGFQFVGTKERFEKFNMVGPFREGITTFMLPRDSVIEFSSLKELKGYLIGTVRGYAYEEEFDRADYLKKEEATDNETNVRKLAAGRLHMIVGDRDTLAFLAKRLGLSDRFRFADTPLAVVPRYIAFPKARSDQAAAFAQKLEEIKASGDIQSIIEKYTR